MGVRSDDALVVVPVTRPVPPADPGQLDLFGPPPDTVPTPRSPTDQKATPGRVESNDLDLIRHVTGNAARGLYLLVGTADRVYARSDDATTTDAAVRVPGYEEAAVHQLIDRGWLTTGNGQHRVTCGAAHLTGTAVLAPRSTRNRITRWEALARPASWQPDHGHANRTRR
jgi:hypothetical protein